MKGLAPLSRVTAVMGILLVIMFSRSLSAAGAGLLAGVVCLFLVDGRRKGLKWACGALALCAATAVIDPIFSHRGMTVLLFVNDRPYTLESMLYGLELGLSLSGAGVWLAVLRGLVNEREMLGIFGRFSPKLAMTVSMTLGFIPRLIRKNSRIREAQRGAGLFGGDSPSGRLEEVSAVFTACMAWSAEAAAGAAQSMNARGFGTHKITFSDRRALRLKDVLFISAAVLLTVGGLVLSALGGATEFFPKVDFGRYEMAMTAVYMAECILPIIILAKERLQWTLYGAKD